jgi:undecaprenyl-diphosphatase
MSNWEAIILGILQGISEFLPISSSGHLEIAKVLMGNAFLPSESLLMTIVLHGATALSTLVVFRKDILAILKGLMVLEWNPSWRFALWVVLSMLPAAFVGLFFEAQIATLFSGNLILVGLLLLVTAALLFFADRAGRTAQALNTKSALVIGLAQCIAILPGLSRSGATIGTALLLKIERSEAARFSFLMVIPLILGSMAKSIMDLEDSTISVNYLPLGLGFISAFITGIVACQWMIALVKRSKLTYFSLYCSLVGLIALIYGLR